MQLTADVDNIDIERNMSSTFEQEPLNEKFISEKAIDHLVDDVTSGNKENIQKQQNIILDAGEDMVIDTDKEITPSGDEILPNNLNVEISLQDTVDIADVVTSEEITEDNNINDNLEPVVETPIIESANKEESLLEENEARSEEINKMDVTEIKDLETEIKEVETEIKEVETEIKEVETEIKEVGTERKEVETEIKEVETEIKQVETDLMALDNNSNNDGTIVKEIDITEIPTDFNEENEIESDKEVDISELSTEINEEKKMDLDKEDDTVEASEGNEENVIELDNNDEVSEEKSIQSEVSNTSLENDRQVSKCSEIELVSINETNEKNFAIEIDDEDEKMNDVSAESDQNVQVVLEDTDNTDEGTDKHDETENIDKPTQADTTDISATEEPVSPKRICRLSNNLDIFSDEEDDQPSEESTEENVQLLPEKQSINIDDDDDIMLIDEESSTRDSKKPETSTEVQDTNPLSDNSHSASDNSNQSKNEIDADIDNEQVSETIEESFPNETEDKDIIASINETSDIPLTETNKMTEDKSDKAEETMTPLLPKNFITTCKKNLSDMTRNDLEEFCILKIVESIVDRSNLGEIKSHLKNLTQTMEECKKKCLMLSKQNKDLQIVLKSVQEEQKSGSDMHITPLKITRSVGMQVVMVADKINPRKKPINGVGSPALVPNNNTKQVKNQQMPNTRNQKEKAPVNQIPVPRLVPATPPAVKSNQTSTNNTASKQANTGLPNGIRNSPPVQKIAEKRARSQAVTVDLTDDEPPAKLQNVQRGSMNLPMRVLTTEPNLIPPQRFINQSMNSPRKVYIPISGPQAQNVRPGQTIMLKTLSGLGPRPRAQAQALITKSSQTPNSARFGRGQPNRHPAPLPDAMKQYQPPNWKALPPAPDLKLSKVENGIVISWKIDGYEDDDHEEIASYQLYAYQETSSPPNSALWKKIGDVKALPLPMACTLTQFMAGYKYYFAVRAVDIRSRFGPFSLPGSILLLNKM